MTITTRRPSPAELEQLRAARLRAVEYAPYLAHALYAARPVAAIGLGTFAVDARWRLYIDPETLTEWGPQMSGAVLVHEAGHLVRDHAGRARDLPGEFDPERWNYATDAAINDDLVSTGVPLPQGVVTPQSLGLDAGGIEEAYYGALTPRAPQEDGGGCGSGAGDPQASWELEGEDPRAPGLDSGQESVVRRRVAEDVRRIAEQKGRGSVPSGMERWAEWTLDGAPLPWRRVLAGMVRRVAALTAGRVTYSYSRPGRRRIPRVITPAMRAPKVSVSVVVDTSGSMSESDLAAALVEVDGVVKAVGGAVTVLACDAESDAPQTVRSARDVRLTGGGGTDMRVGIAAAEARRTDVVVVLTDGGTPWPDAPTRAHLVVVVIGDDGLAEYVPGWARVLTVPSGAL